MKQPVNPFHPGEIRLEEFLQPLGMTQTAFAEKLGKKNAFVDPWVEFSRRYRFKREDPVGLCGDSRFVVAAAEALPRARVSRAHPAECAAILLH